MDETLRKLYESFCTPLPLTELRQSVEENRALLREKLPADDRKVVLRIVDAMSLMCEEQSYHNFVCGFRLAYRLVTELNNYRAE